MIVVPILAESIEEVASQAASLDRHAADGVELRLDYFRGPIDLPALRRALAEFPTIVTCRLPEDGGRFRGEETTRIALLQQAIDLGFEFVDVEAESFSRVRRGTSPSRLIASRHDFTATPSGLPRLFDALASLSCDIVKFSGMANDLRDNLRLFDALASAAKPAIGICMGELGEASRILNLRFGSFLTFGSLCAGRESAPGQIPYLDLAHLYRVRTLRPSTALYAVAGDPIAHSMSPAIHNAAFSRLGLDAVYLRFRVSDFPVFLREVAEPLGLRGLSVTIPHQDAALRAAVAVDDLARRIGAVNTLTRIPEGWEGRNTDCEAAIAAIRRVALRAGIDLRNADALLLGAGGTARAIGFGLREAGCRLVVANRTPERGRALAEALGGEAIAIEDAPRRAWRVVANATSVGMHPETERSPVPAEVFRPGMVAFDAVYNPRETKFLREARARGAEIADGVEMFVGQAAAQFERWTGRPAPREAMEEVVLQRLARFMPLQTS